MTSPINPTVIQQPGILDGVMDSFMQAYAVSKEFKQRQQAYELQKEEFELSKLKFKKDAELTDEQILSYKLERKKTETDLANAEDALEGARQGVAAVNSLAVDLADIPYGSPEWQSTVRNAQVGLTHPAAFEMLEMWTSSMQGGEATRLERERVRLSEEQLSVDQEKLDLQQSQDQVARGATLFDTAVKTPLPLGPIADQMRITVPQNLRGINLFGAAGGTAGGAGGAGDNQQRMTEAQMRASAISADMALQLPILEHAIATDNFEITPLTSFVGRMNPEGLISGTVRNMLHGRLNDQQQELLMAGMNLSRNWVYLVSGAAVNEKEGAQNFVNAVPTSSDSEAMKRAKTAILRSRMYTIQTIAQGNVNPSDVAIRSLESMVDASKSEGWPAEMAGRVQRELNRAREWKREQETNNLVVFPPAMYDSSGEPIQTPASSISGADWDRAIDIMQGRNN